MTQHKRPDQINNILNKLNSGDDAEFSTELAAYITDLEAKQPARPSRIITILKDIGSQFSEKMMTALEAYLTELESNQVLAYQQDTVAAYDPENPPVWSQERAAGRKRRRQERAIKKLNNYQ